MNDVQQIQRINAMSQELKRFGFSENTVDAIEGAKNILMNDEEQHESSIFTEENEVSQLSNMFCRFKDSTMSKMNEMSRHISNLNTEISKLNSTISVLQSRREEPLREHPSPPPQPRIEECEQSPPRQEAKRESQERSEKPYYEKQGHFTPENVKIEDFFYFGKK
ncbi:MAG: hypothetical protein KKF89_05020 [Nanoarchaeota archaeon]|nr:hypothetical protein [Nanoarchaeota archaeon]MBU1855056.1 hypothetical protein [Nanoarchaeota archaeon]